MMLHEAVMLEIYRQALTASELTSPRCQSRESNVSAAAMEGRCPSNGSHCSGNERSTTPATTSLSSTPPAGLPLSATLAPAAAAALLPPQSAAMAAYFNAAAAAAQQNHLLLTNPLAAAASLVQQATRTHSPTTTTNCLPGTTPCSPQADAIIDEPVLDFSTKRRRESEHQSEDDELDEKMDDDNCELGNGTDSAADVNSPLDLSVGRKREASDDESQIPMRKTSRATHDYKPLPPAAAGNWVPTINPYLAAVAAASLSPKSPLSPLEWCGKHKLLPNEATKALEKMTEMTRLGSATDSAELPPHRQVNTTSNNSMNNTGGGRHSAWQSHWLNKGADAVRDVFKCVWCKQSFPTLASLTTHMKETQHCGVSMPAIGASGAPTNSGGSGGCSNQTTQSTHHLRHSANTGTSVAATSATTTATATSTSNKSDLNLLIKETMPLPRKLVRGQDVWLGKGAEQTREILKCMWCGQSFRSLAEMTSHMQATQHYTNIISQEQIISWKSTDDKNSNSGSGSNSNGASSTSPIVISPPSVTAHSTAAITSSPNNTSAATVSAVLTCKVCDQAFPSLKELSNHMMKNSHYKEHMMRSIVGSGGGGCAVGSVEHATTAVTSTAARRGRQMREKRKKSLPVRKLLELERAQQEYKLNNLDPALKPLRDFAAMTKITCEKCGEKIETALFVDHIRLCLGGMLMVPARTQNSEAALKHTSNSINCFEQLASPHTPTSRSDGRKTSDSNASHSSARPEILCPLSKEVEKTNSSTPSVLNALEQLIEKSFDTRARNSSAYSGNGSGSQRSTPLGSSILKRLGIDDSNDYSKPLLDPQTMHFMRSYANFSARDRSASESSSISERCNSRIESFTPERNHAERARQSTPRLTPEKFAAVETNADTEESTDAVVVHIKSEPLETSNEPQELTMYSNQDTVTAASPKKISVKKEFNMIDNQDEERQSNDSLHYKPQAQTPCSRTDSPSASERSITPKSTSSSTDKRFPTVGSSLNALSSMFDNLNNMNTSAANTQIHATDTLIGAGETNNNNTNKKTNGNPLAALQKLCETTEKPALKSRSSSNGHSHNTQLTGNMMAFSWACNDAVQTSSAESNIKCSQCDAVFNSKGAYRHHFSKVHYIKDDSDMNASSNAMKSPTLACSPKSAATSPKSCSKSPMGAGLMAAPIINPYSESSQSKFLKYTELAKQLSSKNV